MRSAFLILLLAVSACSPRLAVQKKIQAAEKQFHDHIGFYLYDPTSGKELINYQADRYFTPASNTKILTLFASLKVLGDSIPALHYEITGDSLIFWGTGDPTLLYNQVSVSNPVLDFLRQAQQPLYFSSSNFQEQRFGPGWAWDDFNASYSPERSPLPLYGNVIEISWDEHLQKIVPASFRSQLAEQSGNGRTIIERPSAESNKVVIKKGERGTGEWIIPFRASDSIMIQLLMDTLNKEVKQVNRALAKNRKTLYTTSADSVYKVLMQQSDNFLAEQLMLACAGVLTDTLQIELAIQSLLKNELNDLPDQPVWVDGSGLSRYNQITPRSVVALWNKIYDRVPRERLFPLLATGGGLGTLRNWYKAETPFIYGKTGSLTNNHSLSGYLITKKGNVLCFALMNANFVVSSNEVRTWMQSLLYYLRDRF